VSLLKNKLLPQRREEREEKSNQFEKDFIFKNLGVLRVFAVRKTFL